MYDNNHYVCFFAFSDIEMIAENAEKAKVRISEKL